MKKFFIVLLSFLMIASLITISGCALGSNPPYLPSIWTMGKFATPNGYLESNSINPSQVQQWLNCSFGINRAYQVGATEYPYQYYIGTYPNGALAIDPITVQIRTDLNDWYPEGAPLNWALDPLDYPLHVFYVQNGQTQQLPLCQNIQPSPTNPTWANYTAVFQPIYATNTSFYIVVACMEITTILPTSNNHWVDLYIGEGEYVNSQAHVIGTPTHIVNSGGLDNIASVEWAFSGGTWSAKFEHYINNNPADNSSANIQVLQTTNFSYKTTGGIENLSYTFNPEQAGGVYAWNFIQNYSVSYGEVFIVYNNMTTIETDTPPMISITIVPHVQGSNSSIYITAGDKKSSVIYIMVSVWFSNDRYTIPSPSYANVIMYWEPYTLNNGKTENISVYNTFYGNLNVEVLSENTYGLWNNSYASAIVKSNIYQNGTLPPFQDISKWLVSPFSSTLNIILLACGVLLLFYDFSKFSKPQLIGKGANATTYAPTQVHLYIPLILIALSFVNWALLGISI